MNGQRARRALCGAALAAAALAAQGRAREAAASSALPALVSASAVLSAEQQAWLHEHPRLRFAPEQAYGPFVYALGDGSIAGLSIDMLQLVQARTGIGLAVLPAQPLHLQLEAARQRDADLLSSLRPTPERAQYLAFTAPYVSVPAILVVRGGGNDGIGAAADLTSLAGRSVALGRGYAVEGYVREHYPAVRVEPVSDDDVALRGLAAGRYDAAVADAASVAYIVRQYGLRTLQPGAPIGFDYTLSFAVRGDWPELRDILDAGIRAITPAERQAVMDRWITPLGVTPPSPRFSRVMGIGAGLVAAALLLGLGGALWRRRRVRRGAGRAP